MESEWLTSSNLKITPEDWQFTPSSVQQALLQVLERLGGWKRKSAACAPRLSGSGSRPGDLRAEYRNRPRVTLRVSLPGSHTSRVVRGVALSPVTKDISANSPLPKSAAV